MAEADKHLIERLSKYTGLSASKMATEAGLTPSTLTRPLHQPVKHRLSVPTLEKLKAAFPDFEGWVEAEIPEPNAIPFKMEGASLERMREDLPIYGTALGAAREIDGEAIEQTMLNTGEIIQYAKRPTILNGRADAYGLYVAGSSMEPRHMDGEIIVVDPKGRFRNGDDVVVYLKSLEDADDLHQQARAVLVKRLVRRTSTYVELEQFSPAKVFRIDAVEVRDIHRVMPWSELIG